MRDFCHPASRRPKVLICGLLALMTFTLFSPTLRHDFVHYDDPVFVTENPRVKAGLSAEGVRWALSTQTVYCYPLTWLSHMLDCEVYGLHPGGHHLTNVVFHAANSVLLFLVMSRMTGDLLRSAFVAALFALHPLQVQSVAWVSERKGLLSAFWGIFVLGAYVAYAERPGWLRYLAVVLAFILGLMAKPMLVTVPFALLLLDYWPLKRLRLSSITRRRAFSSDSQTGEDRVGAPASTAPYPTCSVSRLLWEKVPLLVLSAASTFVSAYCLHKGRMPLPSLELLPLPLRIENALVTYATYIVKTLWPRHLAVLYPHAGGALPAARVVLAAVLLLGITLWVVSQARRRPFFICGWFWYLGNLVPVIGLVQFGSQAMADRFTYVPGIGLFIILAWGLPDMAAGWRHRKVVLACASAAILSALAICTSIQIRYWRDSVTLFRHAIEVTANNAVMHYNLATVLETEGKPGEAALHYAEAIRINALYPEAHGNLAVLLARQGRSQEAMKHFQAVLRLKPDDPWPHINLGIALEEQGRTEEAVACYRKALALRPDLPSGLANLAWLLATDETIGSGNSSEAVELAERACALTGYEHPEFLDTLAAAYANASRFPDAVRTALKAVELARTKADAELTRAIEHRLRLYQEGRPCRDIRRPQDRVQSPRDSASGD